MGSITAGLSAVGAGIVALGVGVGIGLVGGAAVQAMARQPDMTPKIQVNMLIAAAMVEGVALFCAVICILAMSK